MNYFIWINIIIIIIIILIIRIKYCTVYESFNNVPLNIIQTWKNNEIPLKYKLLVSKIKKLNPNCKYLFFTDDKIDYFIKSKFPNYYSVFNNFPLVIQKIDFFRYLAIYYYGGVYLDLDIRLDKSLEDLNQSKQCVFPLEFQQNSDKLLQNQGFKGLIGNYAFYAPKKHQFIKQIIDNIVNNRIPMSLDTNSSNYMKYVYYTTGPVMVTQSYLDFKSKNQIKIIKKILLRNLVFVTMVNIFNLGLGNINQLLSNKKKFHSQFFHFFNRIFNKFYFIGFLFCI